MPMKKYKIQRGRIFFYLCTGFVRSSDLVQSKKLKSIIIWHSINTIPPLLTLAVRLTFIIVAYVTAMVNGRFCIVCEVY